MEIKEHPLYCYLLTNTIEVDSSGTLSVFLQDPYEPHDIGFTFSKENAKLLYKELKKVFDD